MVVVGLGQIPRTVCVGQVPHIGGTLAITSDHRSLLWSRAAEDVIARRDERRVAQLVKSSRVVDALRLE